MCKYCEATSFSKDYLSSRIDNVCIDSENRELIITLKESALEQNERGGEVFFTIYFCPMCGVELSKLGTK